MREAVDDRFVGVEIRPHAVVLFRPRGGGMLWWVTAISRRLLVPPLESVLPVWRWAVNRTGDRDIQREPYTAGCQCRHMI